MAFKKTCVKGRSNPKRRYQYCPLCPNLIGGYKNIMDYKSSKLYNHLISQHQHLLFQCCFGRGYRNDTGWSANQQKCNKTYQYFLTFSELKKHCNYVHKERRFGKQKFVIPEDIRSARCNICNIAIVSRGKYQIQKHVWLEHGDKYEMDVTLCCRLCPRFESQSFAVWKNHFSRDNKRCNGQN